MLKLLKESDIRRIVGEVIGRLLDEGIDIDPENRGKFNATKKRTGKSTEELTHSKNPLTRKRAIFAQNAKKWHYKKKKKVNEAANNSFSLSDLDKCGTFKEMIEYCQEHVGEESGMGSSRIVFQLDDEKVIKIAYNVKGLAQNKEEAESFKKCSYYSFIPRVYAAATDGRYIVSEFVLPATVDDFWYCLGMSNYEFGSNLYALAKKEGYQYNELQKIPFFNELEQYMQKMDVPFEELDAMENWGLGKRNGIEHLILLDHGLNNEIRSKYYWDGVTDRSTIAPKDKNGTDAIDKQKPLSAADKETIEKLPF